MNSISYRTASEAQFSITFAEIDVDTAHNLQLIFNRARGELFCVEEGRLQLVRGLRARLSYFRNRERIQFAVKNLMTQAVHSVYSYLEGKEEEEVSRVLGTLFDRIRTVSASVLDFSALTGHKVDFRNSQDQMNWMTFLQRKKGEKCVVDREGRVRIALFSTRAEKEEIKRVVTTLLQQLNQQLQRTDVTVIHKVVLREIFFKGSFRRMSQAVYNRGAIAEGSSLERALGSEIGTKREALRSALKAYRHAADKVEARGLIAEKNMEFDEAEGSFADLDLQKMHKGGSGGARTRADRFGNKIFVIKPGDEGPHGINNPQWYARIKRWFVSPRACLRGNSEPQAEVGSYRLSERLGIHLVPMTESRYVASPQFVGTPHKECSLQMFVEGCVPLTEYLSLPPQVHYMPRRFLRWYLDTAEIRAKIPPEIADRLTRLNLMSEDLDCHLDNILVKVEDFQETVFDRLLRDEPVEDEEIDAVIDTFFSERHNQSLLRALLYSIPIEIGGVLKRVTFITPDGGSSQPFRHPDDCLSTRFKHFFEVLPQFNACFTSQEHFANKERDFIEFLLEKGTRALRYLHTPPAFRAYWNQPIYRQRFKEWLLERDPDQEPIARRAVIRDLLIANGVQRDGDAAYRFYYISELERIHRSISTRIDSWKVTQKFMHSNRTMREALQVVTPRDFERELGESSEDVIEERLLETKQRRVNPRETQLRGNDFSENAILIDLGERRG